MNTVRTFLQHFYLILIITSASLTLSAQSGENNIPGDQKFIEKVLISTDRDIYITGEEVWIKVYKMNRITGTSSALGRIVYTELLDETNNPVIQLKIGTDGISGSGSFLLPDTLSSGNYVIRAYTSWMLNYPESLFSYKVISVVNPYKVYDRLIRTDSKSGLSDSYHPAVNSNTEKEPVKEISGSKIKVAVNPDNPEYSRRSKVRINLIVADGQNKGVESNLSLSAVRFPLIDRERIHLTDEYRFNPPANSFRNGIASLPELEGEIISGAIKNRMTNEPLAGTDISFCVVGKSARCQFTKTSSSGGFMFVADRLYGLNDIVIQPLTYNEDGCYVELNQPFCTTFSDLSPGMFWLDSIKAEQINKAVVSMQVNNNYRSSRQEKKSVAALEESGNFYGKPDRRIILSDYIELTDIREVIKEIMPEVRLFRKDDKYGLRIYVVNPARKYDNQVLVMVDGIPVYNIEKLLDVPSRSMERIDIVNVRYFIADYVFEGIVNFVTKKGNFSDLEFDNTAFRQIWEGCQKQQDFYSPVYDSDSLKNRRIPDFRNTLFWTPDLKTDSSGKAFAEFYTSDEPGEYLITVEGIASDSEPVYSTNVLTVK
jgi:hypothetical protein